MTAQEKRLERIHILRTIMNYGPEMPAIEIANRCNTECDHDALEALPEISRRGIGQKLDAMRRDGLVTSTYPPRKRVHERVALWSTTDFGRRLAESL